MDKILKFSCSSALSNSKTMWLGLEQPGVVAFPVALACQLTPVRWHASTAGNLKRNFMHLT